MENEEINIYRIDFETLVDVDYETHPGFGDENKFDLP